MKTAAWARVLQNEVDGILGRTDPKLISGAINWGNLGCTDVTISLLTGSVYVTIEEASPDASQLHRHVERELERAGYLDVSVLTEW